MVCRVGAAKIVINYIKIALNSCLSQSVCAVKLIAAVVWEWRVPTDSASEICEKKPMELSEEEIKGVLDGALQCSQDVNLISYRSVCNAPNGFNGLYYTILIKYSVKNNEEKELSCFCKSVPPNEQHVAYIRGTRLLHKEHEFFHKILPTFRKFANFDLPVPDCYFLRFEEHGDFTRNVVVLQDLACHGFVTRDPKVAMNYKECSVVIQALAKLHAASLITSQKGK
jgi:Ecdysteroid kinase-like family